MKIEYNKEDMEVLMQGVSESLAEDIKDEVKRLIKMETGYATGDLENSIQVRKTQEGFEVFSDVPQAVYLEYGTGLFVAPGMGVPHRIVPTTKKFLSWIDPRTGDRIFAKSVKGIQPRFFFTKSTDLTLAQYNNDITRKVMRYATGLAKIGMAEEFEKKGLSIGRAI